MVGGRGDWEVDIVRLYNCVYEMAKRKGRWTMRFRMCCKSGNEST